MATCLENQLTYDTQQNLIFGAGAYRVGQRLTISNRLMRALSFWLKIGAGNPSSIYNFRIRRVSDDSILFQIQMGNPTDMGLTTSFQKITYTGVNTTINEEVRILVEQNSGGSDASNYVSVAVNATSVKANEQRTYYTGSYTDDTADCAYEYSYDCAASFTPVVYII